MRGMKIGLTLLIGLLVLYAPAELTRVIFAWGPLDAELIFEVCFIWVCYAIAITLVYKFIWRW